MSTPSLPITRQEIKEILLRSGFSERQQPDGGTDLNPYVYEGVEEILRQTLTRVNAAPLCEDEGCPHHGTPHVCVNNSDLNMSLQFFWSSAHWNHVLTSLPQLTEKTKAYLQEKSREVDRLRQTSGCTVVGEVRVLPNAGNGTFFNVHWLDPSKIRDGAKLLIKEA